MATHSPLLAYSDDILVLILEQCEKSSISNLSLVNKNLRSRCTPQLYREIDLSSHNIGRFHEYEDDTFHPEQWTNMDDHNRPKNLLSLQRSFLRTMSKCLDYAEYVRSFSWTLIWYDQHEEEGLTEIDYHLWTVFSHMDRVEKLDLAATPGDKSLESYTREVPPILFPHVTDLRLMGWMPHNLAVNIFNSMDLSKLRVLRLDTLQEEGHLSDGSLVGEDFNKEHWNDEGRAQVCEGRRKGSTPIDIGTIFPGPMWVTFVPLVGKFNTLQCLEIHIPPLEDARMGDRPDHITYISVMAELIKSVLPSLERLTIEYTRGTAMNYRDFYRAFSQRIRNSELILSLIFPSLSTDEWEWKYLQKVSLKGFLHDKKPIGDRPTTQKSPLTMQYMTNIQTIQARIEACLSNKGFTLEWLDDSTRPAFLYMGLI